jgi:hypothetical protein
MRRILCLSSWVGCFALVAASHASAARAVVFSPGASVDVPPPYATGTVLSRVGCASATLCVTTDQLGHIFTSTAPAGDYSAWVPAQSPTTQSLGEISCPTTSLCVTVGTSDEVTSTDPGAAGAVWQAGMIDSDGDLSGISCASSSLCVAATTTGVIVSTDPARGAAAWTGEELSPSKPITAIACPSDDLCVAVDSAGEILTSDDPAGGAATWQVASVDSANNNGTSGFTSLACASTSLCVAGDVAGHVFTTSNPAGGASTWTSAEIDPQPPCYSYHGAGECAGVIYGVSCPSTTACVAIDGSDHLLTSTNPTGGPGAWASTGTLGVESVTCPSTTLCLAPGNGSVLFSTTPFASGATFSQALYFDGNPELPGLACRPTFCAAVDSGGHVHTTADPATGPWSTTNLNTVGLDTISCPSAQLCATMTYSGETSISTDPTASDPTWVTADLGLAGFIDCPTTQLCLAENNHAQLAVSTDPTGGQQAWMIHNVYARLGLTGIACPTRHFCILTTREGQIAVTHHPAGPASAWRLENIDPGQNPLTVHRPVLESISCPSRSFCAVTDDEGHVVTSRDPGSAHADWQRHRIYGNQPLGGVTCASDALCVASDGGSWK